MIEDNIRNNIRRNMKLKGMTIKSLSEACGIGSATLSNLLNGKGYPSTRTLLSIASALEIQIECLFSEAPYLTDYRFRTKKTLTAREKAAKDQLIINCAQWLKDYNYLERITGEKSQEYKFSGDYSGVDPEYLAEKIRSILQVDVSEPLNDIMSLIAEAGVKVRSIPFGIMQTFGVSVGKTDGGPAVFINSAPEISIERQLFTAAHELGHLLMHQDTYSDTPALENPVEERDADNFASHLLMPEDSFARKWEEYRGYSWLETVLLVKQYFHVSYQTVLYRYAISNSLSYADLVKKFRYLYKEKYKHSLADHYEPNAISRIGINREDRFSSLVRIALEKGEISSARAAEMLGLNIYEMRDLVESWQI